MRLSRIGIIFIWLVIIILLLYAFYFHPEFFQHLFDYPGPGSPFINTPRGPQG